VTSSGCVALGRLLLPSQAQRPPTRDWVVLRSDDESLEALFVPEVAADVGAGAVAELGLFYPRASKWGLCGRRLESGRVSFALWVAPRVGYAEVLRELARVAHKRADKARSWARSMIEEGGYRSTIAAPQHVVTPRVEWARLYAYLKNKYQHWAVTWNDTEATVRPRSLASLTLSSSLSL
jgi:hypothetical protein